MAKRAERLIKEDSWESEKAKMAINGIKELIKILVVVSRILFTLLEVKAGILSFSDVNNANNPRTRKYIISSSTAIIDEMFKTFKKFIFNRDKKIESFGNTIPNQSVS